MALGSAAWHRPSPFPSDDLRSTRIPDFGHHEPHGAPGFGVSCGEKGRPDENFSRWGFVHVRFRRRGEDTWPKVLERELGSRFRQNVQVINAGGASGFSPSPYYFFIKQNLARFDPDIVILGLTAQNDVADETRYQWGELGKDSLPLWGKFSGEDAVNARGMRAAAGEDAPLRYRLPIISHSHLARLAGRALGSLMKARGDVQSQSYLKEYPEDVWKALMRVNHLIRGLNLELRQRGVKFAVLVIPSIPQVDPREDPISLGYFPPGRGREDMDYGRPQSRLIPEFRKNSILFVDPRPEISEALRAGKKVYYRYDGHWTKEGHALAGKLLAERLFRKDY